MVDHDGERLHGARFRNCDLTGLRMRGVLLRDAKISGSFVERLDVSGDVVSLVVNGIDVAAYVNEELLRRHPERRLHEASDPDDVRAAWADCLARAAATVERARSFPPAALDESVDGEWSYLQTLRHLVFATDRWITGPVLGESPHFHPLGYPYDEAGDDERAGLDLDARPSLDEVLAVRADRQRRVSELVADATADDLARVVPSPNGGDVEVVRCIRVVLREEWWHDRYANRDLTAQETPPA